MKRFMNKKVAAIGLAAGLLLGAGGAAFAYFTGSGTGTGTGSVGSGATWAVSQSGSASGAMYPGVGTSVVTFSLQNTGTGYQGIDSVSQTVAAINDDGSGNITQGGVALPGCLSTWFGVTSVGAPSVGYGHSVAPTASTTVAVTVHMNNVDANQDVCKTATPDVNLTVSHS
jgi:hypothetical protein